MCAADLSRFTEVEEDFGERMYTMLSTNEARMKLKPPGVRFVRTM